MGKKNMLRDVVNLLVRCDPSDPLGVRGMLDDSPGKACGSGGGA
jgi:hypothetical protein